MSHERPWEEVDSSGIEFGEVMNSSPADLGSPWDGAEGRVVELQMSIGENEELSSRDRTIVIEDPVWQRMIVHAMKQPNLEVGGMLLGSIWKDSNKVEGEGVGGSSHGIWIQEIIQAEFQESTSTSLRFTHETWQAIARKHQSSQSNLAIIGWYHTHPNWGIFLSPMDEFICKSFFPDVTSLAIVIDPQQKLAGCFEWNEQRTKMVKRTSIHLRLTKEQAVLRSESKANSLQDRKWEGVAGLDP